MTHPDRPSGNPDPVLAAARLTEEIRGLVLLGREAVLEEARQLFAEPLAVAAALRGAAGGVLLEGRAFGGPWPVVETPVGILAPGLPVLVGRAENPGPDGVYRREGDRVLREAVGAEAVVARLDDDAAALGEPFALLWFGPAERYVLAAGELTVEDLFAAIHLPATDALLDRLLVRGRRLPGPLPSGLAGVPTATEARVEIRRHRELLPGDDAFDPVRILQLRPEVERVRRAQDDLVVRRVDEAPLRFTVVRASAAGWELALVEGRHPFVRLALDQVGSTVRYVGTLHPEIDPLAPGVRNRLAFDLQADLVAL